jgi:uncharacterized membrane protein
VALSAGVGLVAGLVAVAFFPWQVAVLAGWDVSAGIFCGWAWAAVSGLDADHTRQLATREDSSRAAADLMLLVASVACLVGVGFTLVKASQSHGAGKGAFVALAVVSVVVSWAVVHTVFALRYARLYYGDDEGGIDFNGEDDPVYADFAYVSFTLGMTFQVSDTDIETRPIRTTALRQALLSYLFGAVIVAMTINVTASLLSQ